MSAWPQSRKLPKTAQKLRARGRMHSAYKELLVILNERRVQNLIVELTP